MTTITIPNSAVTEVLGDTESVTVPAGETWSTTVTVAGDYDGNTGTSARFRVSNGVTQVPVLGHHVDTRDDYNNTGGTVSKSKCIFSAGQTLDFVAPEPGSGCYVSGFVTDNTNSVVTEVLDSGDSVTVPSGEVWKTTVCMYGRIDTNQSQEPSFRVDGTNVMSPCANVRTGGTDGAPACTADFVFVAGQVLSFNAAETPRGCYISGFVVN